MQAEPFSGVTAPLDFEAVAADPVEAGERGVELFAEIFGKAGAVALDETVLGAVPLAEDVDGIIEVRRSDGGQKAGLEKPVDQLPTGRGYGRFFCRRETGRSHVSLWLTPLRRGLTRAVANATAAARRAG